MEEQEEKEKEQKEEYLDASDHHALEVVNAKKEHAQTNLEKSQIQLDALKMHMDHMLFKLSLKYQLSEKDSVDTSTGKIIRGKNGS